MAAAGRDVRDRGAGREPQQAALRVELIQQRSQIVLVGAAAVQEDQRALGLAGRLPDAMWKVGYGFAAVSRGLVIGFSRGST